ncbi:solute carrier family 25 member 43-like [Branchiostoma lanceolatum]|uniref:solute carrier family 25 member 43-like n=1 Tax=Branchiostoma lanceolatum TaxID=7740 RepID=UPI003452A74D
MGSRKDHRLTFLQSFVCGGTAGVTSRTLTSPLDVVKILSQVGTKDTQEGFLKAFSNLYKNEGLRAFWKGNFLGCMRLFPYTAIQFSAYTKFRQLFVDDMGYLSAGGALLAGSLGGITATCIMYPTDMVKTRLTAQHAKRSKAHYRGIFHAFRVVYRTEGITAFFRGMSTSVIGVIPFAGGTFMAYELLDRAWSVPSSHLTPLANFINGCIAAAFAQTFSYPFDTIRKKLQAYSTVLPHRGGVDVEFTGMVDAFFQTYKHGGTQALWRGTTANLMKVVPYAGVMFMSFEACKRTFLYSNGFTVSPWSDVPKPGIDQTLTPGELREWHRNQRVIKRRVKLS